MITESTPNPSAINTSLQHESYLTRTNEYLPHQELETPEPMKIEDL